MECLACLQAKAIPNCLTELIVGTVTELNADIKVKLLTFFGRSEIIETVTDGTGLITLNLSDVELANGIYKITAYTDTDPVNELEITTDDGATGFCIEVRITDGESVSATITSK